jgi:hypothetical protein
VPNDLVLFQLRETALESGPGAILGPRVLSFGLLETNLSQELGPPLVSDWHKAFVLAGLAPELWPALGLPFAPEAERASELSEDLGDGLDRIRLSNLSWEEIEKLEPPALAATLADLGRRYQAWLGPRDDLFSRRRKILEALEQKRPFETLEGVETVSCRHSQRVSPFESELLKALSQVCRVEVGLNLPSWVLDEKERLRAGFERRRMIRDLEKCQSSKFYLEFSFPEESQERAHPALRYASERLFGPPAPEEDSPPDPREALKIIRTPSQYHQVEEAGRIVKELIHKGALPHRLALAVPDSQSYYPALEDVARRFGLSFHYRRGTSLDKEAPIQAALGLMSLWGSAWERERLARLMESPYFAFDSPKTLREDLLAAGVTDSRAGGGYEANVAKADQRIKSRLEPFLAAAEAIREAEAALAAQDSWQGFFGTFRETLARFGWPGQAGLSPAPMAEGLPASPMAQRTESLYRARVAGDGESARRFLALLDTLGQALAESQEAPPVGLGSFRLWLGKALAQDRSGRGGDPTGKVRVLSYYDLHGAFFEALFLLGLNERSFPGGAAASSFWPQAFIDSLSGTALGRPLWTSAADLYGEEEEIAAAALSQARKAFLFYSDYSEGGRPALKSPFLDSLMALWPDGSLAETRLAFSIPPAPEAIRDQVELGMYLASLGPGPREEALEALRPSGGIPEGFEKIAAQAALSPSEDSLGPAGPERHIPESSLSAWIGSFRKHRDGLPVLPVSPFQDYRNCPFYFWRRHILGLKPWPGEAEEWSPLDRGTVIHRTLERFLSPLADGEKGADLGPERLRGLFRETAREMEGGGPVGRLPLYRGGLDRAEALLLSWLERQGDLASSEILALEWSFGTGEGQKAPPLKIEAQSGSFYLMGRADRLERADGGALIMDYKAQYSERYKERPKEGPPPSHFPLIAYALAAKEALGLPARSLFEFIDPKGEKERVFLGEADPSVFSSIYDRIMSGSLALDKKPECGYCGFALSCRENEE